MNLRETRDAFILDCRAGRKAAKTVRSYGDTINDFISYVGNLDMQKLTADNLREYMASLYERPGKHGKLSSHSAMKYYSVLRTWLIWCYMQGFTKDRITDLVHPPKVSNDLPDALKPEEIDALFEYMKTLPFRDQVMVEFFLDTGCRLGEVAGLTLESINIDQGYAKVHGKGDKDGLVPMGARLCKDLYVYIHVHRSRVAAPSENGLWIGKSGYRLGYEGVAIRIRRILGAVRQSGKEGAHTLRHTFATQFLRSHGDLETLRKILRHNDIKVTQRYVHLSDDDVIHSGQDHSFLDLRGGKRPEAKRNR